MEKRLKKINLGKRAQIGATLTWFVAFLVIFFIMLLFLGATAIVTAKKKLPIISWFAGTGKDKIELVEEYSGNLRMQRDLFTFINMPSIRNLIFEKKNQEIEKEARSFIASLEPEPECYVLKGEREGKTEFEIADFSASFIEEVDDFSVSAFAKKNAITLFLFSKQDEIIKISFYAGECKL